MGFFSELKSDLSQAVNTLMPEDKPEASGLKEKAEEEVKPADIGSMLNRLDDLQEDLESGTKEEPVEEEIEAVEEAEQELTEESFDEPVEEEVEEELEEEPEEVPVIEEVRQKTLNIKEEFESKVEALSMEMEEKLPENIDLEQKIEEETLSEIAVEEPKNAIEAINPVHIDQYVANVNAETETNTRNGGLAIMDFDQQTPTDEVAVITEGMIIKGDLATTGSIDIIGKISGNIKCLGKLNITGEISGDSDAAEVYAESARITGEVKSKGSVKVGQSTVIVGNIFGSSAVIAGAVKGDIDVHGPVVLDTTAIVMGNIKSQSVQINNGAVIEGMCSQAYADVNPSEFFEGLKNR
jgi:cytoskeletal protein CcmA (bactofilin family)